VLAHSDTLYQQHRLSWFNNGGHNLKATRGPYYSGNMTNKLVLEVRKFPENMALQLVAEPEALTREKLRDFIKNYLKSPGNDLRLLDYYGGGYST